MNSAFAVEVDHQLVERAREGDREAFFEIYKMFEQPAYNLAYRLCQCPDEALDVVQEGMLQIVDNVQQYRFEAPFWGWVRRIFINAALMHLRRRQRSANLEILVDAPGEDQGVQLAMHRDIASSFARLAPERRAVLWLYAVEGYSHREIGELMGYSASYSKTQLLRARRQIRQWWTLGGNTGARGVETKKGE